MPALYHYIEIQFRTYENMKLSKATCNECTIYACSMLATIGILREKCHIAGVLSCRPFVLQTYKTEVVLYSIDGVQRDELNLQPVSHMHPAAKRKVRKSVWKALGSLTQSRLLFNSWDATKKKTGSFSLILCSRMQMMNSIT